MRKLHKLLMAALVLVPLVACDEGDDSVAPEPAVGTVSGTVSVEGEGLAGVTVSLAGASSRSTTTGADGSYTFTDVAEGNYSVTLSTVPEEVVFSQASQSVSITSDGQTSTADFNGQYVRTASVLVNVTSGSDGVVTNVRLEGVDVDETKGTNANGQAQFTGLRAGTYTVSLVDPPEGFETTTAEVQLSTGESEQVNFTGEVELTRAEISINSITQGGTPISLSNVNGQIEVTVNIDRGDETLSHVDVLIGDEVVASQSFTSSSDAEEGPQAQIEELTLNVPTDQLQMSESGEAWIPVVTNGGKNVSANLYVEERASPTPSNEVPVVMQNPDAVVAPVDGVLTFEMEEGARTAEGSDGDTWYGDTAIFTGAMYISYSTKEPTSVVWPTTASAGIACGTSDATSTVDGDADSGYMLTVEYGCEGASGSDIVPNAGAAPIVTVTPAGPGPDGTAVVTPTGFSALGAQFTLDEETRRFLLNPAPAGGLTISSAMNIDNLAPDVYVACEWEVNGDGDLVAECDAAKPLMAEQVAYNDLFDERWINAEHTFEEDVMADDSAGAAVGVGLGDVGASLFDETDLVCGMTLLASGDDLNETDASDGTPDGHRVCGLAEDLLGNTGTSEAPSNWFGVDKVDPMVRMGGEGVDALAGISPLDGSGAGPYTTEEAVADTLGNSVQTIYNIGGEFEAGMVWAIEALDDRAGFNENVVDSFPVQQWITRQTATLDSSWLAPNYGFQPAPLSDTWRRSTEEDFLGVWLEAAPADEGYYAYEGVVYDRAGNTGSFFFNWMVDQTDAATVSGVSFAQTFYTPGGDAVFNLFGSDDLEVIEAEMLLEYPAVGGSAIVHLGQFNLDSYMRWDGVMPDPYDASLITRNVIGDQVTVPGSMVFGRMDVICGGAGTPYTSCTLADSVPTDTADYNVDVGGPTGTAEDLLPTAVGAGLIDAGMNQPAAVVGSNFLAGQWTESVGVPWEGAEIVSWAVTLNGSEYEAVHETTTSVTAPFFDSVMLAVIDGFDVVLCEGAFSYNGSTDNGLQRFYNYSIDVPDAESRCGMAITGGGTVHAVGVSGTALLVTQPST